MDPMSENGNTKRLSVNDPIDQETLGKFGELETARMRLGMQLLDVEDERVKILVSSRRVDEEKQKLFEKVLMERGLPPTTPVEIEASTGLIKVVPMPGAPQPVVQPPAPAVQPPAPVVQAQPTA
jgi:hypothetical protein